MAYVYRHIRLDKNEPFYIGVGSDERYWRATKKSQRSKFWKRVVAKTPYEVEILIDDLTWEQALQKEKEFIALYGRYNQGKGPLVNLTDGGDGNLGYVPTKETREKLSKRFKGKKQTITEAEKIRRSEQFKRLNADECFLQKKITALRNSEKLKEFNKSKIGKKGFVHTEQSKNKIRLSKLGKKLPQSVIDKKSIKVIQSTLDGKFIKIWSSGRQIQKETGFSQGNIWRCCIGQYKQCYGYKWEYLKNYFNQIKSKQNGNRVQLGGGAA